MLPFKQIDEVFGKEGPRVIVEVGAADGADTLQYIKRYPRAAIHAFEPLKRNVETLHEVIPLGKAVIHPIALGATNEITADFWESYGRPPRRPAGEPWPYSSSLLPPLQHEVIHPWCKFKKTHTSVVRYEEYLREDPDYVHIDVQGAELAVLRGFGARLDAVRAIWMEVSTVPLYAGQPLYAEVDDFMSKAGFTKTHDTAIGVPSGDQFWRRP